MPPAPPGPNDPPLQLHTPTAADSQAISLAFHWPPIFHPRPPVDPSIPVDPNAPAPAGPDLQGLADAFKGLIGLLQQFIPAGSPQFAFLLQLLQTVFLHAHQAAAQAAESQGP